MEGRAKGLVHLLDMCQTLFSTLSKSNPFTPRREAMLLSDEENEVQRGLYNLPKNP